MAQGSWNFSAWQTNGFSSSSSTQTSYFQSSGDAIMSTPLYWTAELMVNATDKNQSLTQVCDSNSTTIWKLSSPICSTRFESFATVIVVAIVLSFITLWTIVGNIGVVLALYHYRTLRTMSNCLIGNLAISDLLLAITVLPISTTNDMLGYWVFGETMCTIWLCIDVLYCTASIWGLCTIAFDRYTATVYPMWYHDHRSSKKLVVYIVFVWVFSIIISFAPFIGWPDMIPSFHSYSPVLNRFECVLFSTQSYVFYSAIGSFVLPICLMVFLYIRIFSVIHKQASSLKSKTSLSCFTENASPNQNGYPEIISPDGETNTDIHLPRDETGLTVITEMSPISENTYFLTVDGLTHREITDLTLSESDIEPTDMDYTILTTKQADLDYICPDSKASLDYKCPNADQANSDYKNSDVQQSVSDCKNCKTKSCLDHKNNGSNAKAKSDCEDPEVTPLNSDYTNSDTQYDLDYKITDSNSKPTSDHKHFDKKATQNYKTTKQVNMDYKSGLQRGLSSKCARSHQHLRVCSPDCETGYLLHCSHPCDSPLPQNGIRTPSSGLLPGLDHLNGKPSHGKLHDIKSSDGRLADSKLCDVRLGDVKLSDVKLSDVKLSDVKLGDVKLSDVKLNDIKLSDVKLSNVKLSDVKLSDVKKNDSRLGDVKPIDKRSKSVSIVTECSSDSSEEKRMMGRKVSRALPWNMLGVDPNRRMTISMKRRLELREQRATKRMMLIMASFCFCWIPFLVMYVTRSLYADFYINDHFAAAIIWLGYANSGLNPVLYTLFNEDFKKAFKKLLHIGNHRQPF